MARRDDADAVLQNLIAVATSVAAISAVPFTSAGLSGSAGSAASRSHSTRSADCARASVGPSATINANDAIPSHRAIIADRLLRGADKFKTAAAEILPHPVPSQQGSRPAPRSTGATSTEAR